MINRKEFLENSANVIISYAGISEIAMYTNRLFAADSGTGLPDLYSVPIKTDDLINLMNEIDFFGDTKETMAISDGLFKQDMELVTFTGLFCADIVKRYSRKPDKSGVFDAILFSRLCDAHLQLLESLIRMMGNTAFKFYTKLLHNELQKEHSDIIKMLCTDMTSSITLALKKWQSDSSYSSVITGKKCIMGLVLPAGTFYKKEYSFTELNLITIDPLSYLESYHPGRGFTEEKEYILDCLASSRYMCKAIYSRYSLLNAFEKYYRSLPVDEELLTQNNEVTSGARQFSGKLMITLLFIELTLLRMKLICYRCSSGIFSANNRYLFQAEFNSLIDTVQDITEKPVFFGKRLFRGDYSGKPVSIKSGDKVRKIIVPSIDAELLGLRNGAGNDIINVNTPEGSDHASLILKMALKKIRNERMKISGGLSK